MRLARLYPGSLVKPATRTILVPRPMTARVGGQPVRDTALLDWLRDLVDAVLLEPVLGTPPDDPRGSTVPVPTVTRPRRPRLRAALALGLASLALAACGSNLAGAASVVGTQTVSDAEVAAAVDEVRAQFDGGPGPAGHPRLQRGRGDLAQRRRG